MFTRWCVPSVRNQRTSFDGWLVLVAEGFPLASRREIESVLPRFARVLEIPEAETFSSTLERYFRKLDTEIITSRLDADDAIARDFSATVRRSSLPGRVLNLRHGYQYFLHSGGLLHRDLKSNPFISFRSKDGRHVYSLGIHSRVGSIVPVDELWTSRPMYLKIAHNRNTAHNEFSGIPVLFRRVAAVRFGGVPQFPTRSLSFDFMHLRALLGGAYDRYRARILATLAGRVRLR